MVLNKHLVFTNEYLTDDRLDEVLNRTCGKFFSSSQISTADFYKFLFFMNESKSCLNSDQAAGGFERIFFFTVSICQTILTFTFLANSKHC